MAMAAKASLRTLLAAVGAVVCVCLAVGMAIRFIGGPARSFEQRAVPPEVARAIETATGELLALDGPARLSRLREVISPDAPPRASDAVAAQLEAMGRARSWKLAAADGYGTTLVKAIYDLTDRGGRRRQVALIFERRGDGVALLDIAR